MIVVRTSGRHYQEMALFEDMQEISGAVKTDATLFMMATQSPFYF